MCKTSRCCPLLAGVVRGVRESEEIHRTSHAFSSSSTQTAHLYARNHQEHDKYLNSSTDSGRQTCQKTVYSAEENIEQYYESHIFVQNNEKKYSMSARDSVVLKTKLRYREKNIKTNIKCKI